MLLLDEAAVEDRVRRRLLAPAPTDADALVYDQGYDDDSGAALTRGSSGLRLRVPTLAGGLSAMGGLSVVNGHAGHAAHAAHSGEALTERPSALPARDERTSGRLLGGLRERLQQIEQEDFSGGSEGATELYGGREARPLPLGRGAGAAIGGLSAALSSAPGAESPSADAGGSSGRLRGLGELERSTGRSSTPWWAEMPSDNAGARGDGLAPFGPLAGTGLPSLDAPSSALRAELEARRPLDPEAPLLRVLDEPAAGADELGSTPVRGNGGRAGVEALARGARPVVDEAPMEEAPPKRRWGTLAAAVLLLMISAGGVGWLARRPAPALVAAAAELPAEDPMGTDEVNVVVGDLDEVPVRGDGAASAELVAGAGAPPGGPSAEGSVGGAQPVDAAPASFWDRLVDALASRFAGGQAGPKRKQGAKVSVEVVEVEPKAATVRAAPGPAEPPHGTLYVRTKQSAEIFVDGKSVGEAPGLKLELDPGWYTVKAVPRGEGFTWTARTRIDPDMLREVALDLDQEPPPPLKRKESRRRK
jgi:hypothetical protein